MEKRELKDFSIAELTELLEKKTAFYWELRRLADEYITNWELDDMFRNAPRHLEEDSYGRLTWSYYTPRAGVRELIDWTKELNRDYEMFADCAPDIEKAARYNEVLDDDDHGYIRMKAEDYECVEKIVDGFVRDIIARVQSAYNELRGQFDDEATLAEAALDCELLEDFYITDDGKIYRRFGDKLVA